MIRLNLPADINLEKTIIGCMVLDHEQIDEVAAIINVNDMYSETCSVIYKKLRQMQAENKPIDLPSVYTELRDNEIPMTFLTEACDSVITSKKARSYAIKVKEYSKYRDLIRLGKELEQRSSEANEEVNEIINFAENRIYNLGLSNSKQEVIYDLQDSVVMMDYLDELEEAYNTKGITGMSTGITDLDRMLGGFERGGGYTIIAARPSQGKTMLSLNMADYMAINDGPGAYFSSEMKKKKIINRLIAKRCKINGLKLKLGNIKDEDWEKVTDEANRIIEELPLIIIDNKVKKISEIKSIARRLNRKRKLNFIFVDYLQLLEGYENEGNNNLRVEKLSRDLKNLADQLETHVIALAQLSRSCEQRNNKRPILSDLRDSGSIEQDADNVIMVYRDEYYNPDTDKNNIMELLVRKARDGEVGIVEAAYKKEYQDVKDLSRRGM